MTKGSIGINSVSLTVNTIEDCVLGVNLIPHTLEHTNLGDLTIGGQVNIEFVAAAHLPTEFGDFEIQALCMKARNIWSCLAGR